MFFTFDSIINLNLAIIEKGIIHREREKILKNYLKTNLI